MMTTITLAITMTLITETRTTLVTIEALTITLVEDYQLTTVGSIEEQLTSFMLAKLAMVLQKVAFKKLPYKTEEEVILLTLETKDRLVMK